MAVKLCLASASPRRRQLLEQIGLEFEVRPAKGEERAEATKPGELVEALARQKALEAAADMEKDGKTGELATIGADTMVFYQDKAMGKPADRKEAEEMLRLLQGNVHQVYTGVALAWRQEGRLVCESFHACTDVEVYPMEMEEIQSYIDSGEPMDKAGAYGIQGGFARYVKGIRGDYNNVVGLPVGRLYQELKARGFL